MRKNDRRYSIPDSVVREIRSRVATGECRAAVWRDLRARGVAISLPSLILIASGKTRKEVK